MLPWPTIDSDSRLPTNPVDSVMVDTNIISFNVMLHHFIPSCAGFSHTKSNAGGDAVREFLMFIMSTLQQKKFGSNSDGHTWQKGTKTLKKWNVYVERLHPEPTVEIPKDRDSDGTEEGTEETIGWRFFIAYMDPNLRPGDMFEQQIVDNAELFGKRYQETLDLPLGMEGIQVSSRADFLDRAGVIVNKELRSSIHPPDADVPVHEERSRVPAWKHGAISMASDSNPANPLNLFALKNAIEDEQLQNLSVSVCTDQCDISKYVFKQVNGDDRGEANPMFPELSPGVEFTAIAFPQPKNVWLLEPHFLEPQRFMRMLFPNHQLGVQCMTDPKMYRNMLESEDLEKHLFDTLNAMGDADFMSDNEEDQEAELDEFFNSGTSATQAYLRSGKYRYLQQQRMFEGQADFDLEAQLQEQDDTLQFRLKNERRLVPIFELLESNDKAVRDTYAPAFKEHFLTGCDEYRKSLTDRTRQNAVDVEMNKFREKRQRARMQWSGKHFILDVRHSYEANIWIRRCQHLNYTFRVANAHSQINLCIVARQNAFEYRYGMHVNIMLRGIEETSKSFVINMVQKLSIQNTVLTEQGKTGAADRSGTNTNGYCIGWHELNWSEVNGKNGEKTGNAEFKDTTCSGMYVLREFVWLEGHSSKTSKKRGMKITVSSAIRVYIIATNESFPAALSSVQSRFLDIVMHRLEFTDGVGIQNASDIHNIIHGDSPEEKTRIKKIQEEYHRENYLIYLTETMIKMHLLPNITLDIFAIYAELFFEKLAEYGKVMSIRAKQRVAMLARTLTIIHAIEKVFYSELSIIRRIEETGKPWDFELMWYIAPFLYCNGITAIMAMVMMSDSFLEEEDDRILHALAATYCNGYMAGETDHPMLTDIEDNTHWHTIVDEDTKPERPDLRLCQNKTEIDRAKKEYRLELAKWHQSGERDWNYIKAVGCDYSEAMHRLPQTMPAPRASATDVLDCLRRQKQRFPLVPYFDEHGNKVCECYEAYLKAMKEYDDQKYHTDCPPMPKSPVNDWAEHTRTCKKEARRKMQVLIPLTERGKSGKMETTAILINRGRLELTGRKILKHCLDALVDQQTPKKRWLIPKQDEMYPWIMQQHVIDPEENTYKEHIVVRNRKFIGPATAASLADEGTVEEIERLRAGIASVPSLRVGDDLEKAAWLLHIRKIVGDNSAAVTEEMRLGYGPYFHQKLLEAIQDPHHKHKRQAGYVNYPESFIAEQVFYNNKHHENMETGGGDECAYINLVAGSANHTLQIKDAFDTKAIEAMVQHEKMVDNTLEFIKTAEKASVVIDADFAALPSAQLSIPGMLHMNVEEVPDPGEVRRDEDGAIVVSDTSNGNIRKRMRVSFEAGACIDSMKRTDEIRRAREKAAYENSASIMGRKAKRARVVDAPPPDAGNGGGGAGVDPNGPQGMLPNGAGSLGINGLASPAVDVRNTRAVDHNDVSSVIRGAGAASEATADLPVLTHHQAMNGMQTAEEANKAARKQRRRMKHAQRKEAIDPMAALGDGVDRDEEAAMYEAHEIDNDTMYSGGDSSRMSTDASSASGMSTGRRQHYGTSPVPPPAADPYAFADEHEDQNPIPSRRDLAKDGRKHKRKRKSRASRSEFGDDHGSD